MLRFPYLFLLCLLGSCVTQKSNDLESNIVGNWLLVNMRPETPSLDSSFLQTEDSLTRIYTHKLIRFGADGIFTDLDRLYIEEGKWIIVNNQHLAIAKEGKGFELFVSDFVDFDHEKQMLRLRQKISKGIGIDSVPVIWQLKKIDEDHSSFKIFADSLQGWRKKPLAPQSEAAIQEKLCQMLFYYAEYFELISAESDFFVTWRIPLPFKFYAHGVGLKPLEKTDGFQQYFFDTNDAQKAMMLMQQAMTNKKLSYPKRDTYTLEYAAFLKMIATYLSTH